MNKKSISPIVAGVMLIMSFFDIAGAVVPSPELQVQIQAERMQLETARKTMLMSCSQLKETNPDSYARCVGEQATRHEANVQLLMRNPDAYFARKAVNSKE